jgi:DNA repair exonuclease SbcCD ATPase subunit
MRDKRAYACSSFLNGAACSNAIHVRRDRVESALLEPIRNDLLSPERVQRMAKEIQRSYLEAARATQARAAEAPRELEDLAARIERLRERLRRGDPDMTGDEIEAAIDRAEAKRRELQNQQPAAKQSAKILSMLPRVAEAYRRQIAPGLDGGEREALKARVLLRELFGGEVRLVPLEGGGLDARWNLHAASLLRAAGTNW